MSQIHGHGVLIDVTFPDWGNKSASVVLETTFRAIYENEEAKLLQWRRFL